MTAFDIAMVAAGVVAAVTTTRTSIIVLAMFVIALALGVLHEILAGGGHDLIALAEVGLAAVGAFWFGAWLGLLGLVIGFGVLLAFG